MIGNEYLDFVHEKTGMVLRVFMDGDVRVDLFPDGDPAICVSDGPDDGLRFATVLRATYALVQARDNREGVV